MTIMRKVPRNILDYVFLIVGTLCMALAFDGFLVPARIAPGGLTGVSTILHYLFGWPVGLTVFIINIPLFVISFKVIGGQFVVRSLISTTLLSFAIDAVDTPLLTQNPILCSIYGGLLMGLGVGLVFHANASTGGTDLLAAVMNRYFPHIGVGWLLFSIDCLVVLAAAIVFNLEDALYALVAVYLSARVIDLLQEGVQSARVFQIITQVPDPVSKRIFDELERGVTKLDATGMYRGEARAMLLCAVEKNQVVLLKRIVHEEDPQAFVLVYNAAEAMGEGFKALAQPQKPARKPREKGR